MPANNRVIYKRENSGLKRFDKWLHFKLKNTTMFSSKTGKTLLHLFCMMFSNYQ